MEFHSFLYPQFYLLRLKLFLAMVTIKQGLYHSEGDIGGFWTLQCHKKKLANTTVSQEKKITKYRNTSIPNRNSMSYQNHYPTNNEEFVKER